MSTVIYTTALEQRQVALDKANSVRVAGRILKERLGDMSPKDAMLEVARLLGEDPEQVGALPIHSLLMAAPRLGERNVQRILTDRKDGWYIWPFRRVRDLTARQRMRIVGELTVLAARH